MAEFYESSYGGVRIWCSRLTTTGGRTVVVHELTRGDHHPTADQGAQAQRARATLLFDDMRGETSTPRERFDAFRAIVDGGAHTFSHPLLGSYLARIGEFEFDVDDSGVISVDVEFIPDEVPRPVVLAGPATSRVAGEIAVETISAEVDAQLDEVDLQTQITGDIRTAVSEWGNFDDEQLAPVRRVLVDVADLSERTGREIDDLALADDILLWPAYRSLVLMSDALRAAGEAATSEVSSLMTLRIDEPISLRALCARIYGGAEADDRYRQAMSINDIRTPGWLDPGTVLRLPQPQSQPRRT